MKGEDNVELDGSIGNNSIYTLEGTDDRWYLRIYGWISIEGRGGKFHNLVS